MSREDILAPQLLFPKPPLRGMLWGLTPEELYPYDWGKECTHMAKNKPVKLDASFEEQMAAEVPATPEAEERDIEKNFGGEIGRASCRERV